MIAGIIQKPHPFEDGAFALPLKCRTGIVISRANLPVRSLRSPGRSLLWRSEPESIAPSPAPSRELQVSLSRSGCAGRKDPLHALHLCCAKFPGSIYAAAGELEQTHFDVSRMDKRVRGPLLQKVRKAFTAASCCLATGSVVPHHASLARLLFLPLALQIRPPSSPLSPPPERSGSRF